MTGPAHVLALIVAAWVIVPPAVRARPAQQPNPRTGLILGQAIDAASGKPIAGAIVSIGGAGRDANGQPPPRILTRSDGRYLFRDLPRGSFTITASRIGYADGAFGRRRPGGPSQALTLDIDERVGDVNVRLWKLGAIGGTVVDETGEPVVRVQVRAWRRMFVAGHARLGSVGVAFTDDRGMYRFGSLMPGDYVVAASARHVVVPVSMRDVRPSGAVLQVRDFVFGLGGGTITPPPPGDRFSLYPPTYHSGASDAAQATVVSVGAGEERLGVDLQAHPAPTVRVSGVLVGPDGPAGRQVVRLVPEERQDPGLDQDAPAAMTDGAGGFVFPAVAPGSYRLRSSSALHLQDTPQVPREMVWAAMPLQVGTTDLDRVTVALVPGLRIAGHVEFEGSSPRPAPAQLRRVPLLIEPADGDEEVGPIPRVQVDESGEFSSPGLVGGSYVLRVTDSPPGWMFKSATYDGHDISSSPVDLSGFDASGVVITFTDRWSSIQGTVQSPSRGLDADALVVLFPADRRLWTDYGSGPRRLRGVRTSRSGAYAFGSVPPGEYFVAAIPDEKAGDWRDPEFLEALSRNATRVSVGDGDNRTQDLRTRTVR